MMIIYYLVLLPRILNHPWSIKKKNGEKFNGLLVACQIPQHNCKEGKTKKQISEQEQQVFLTINIMISLLNKCKKKPRKLRSHKSINYQHMLYVITTAMLHSIIQRQHNRVYQLRCFPPHVWLGHELRFETYTITTFSFGVFLIKQRNIHFEYNNHTSQIFSYYHGYGTDGVASFVTMEGLKMSQ